MEKFDYIIVGAGSAGCVVANRLSEDPNNHVLLLEAGPEDKSPLIHIPFGIIGLIKEGKHNWGYNTEPQQHLNNRALYWPRGKTLGGSSSINAMVYIRGHPQDYDDWAQMGNVGWDWKSVEPIFRAHEHNEVMKGPIHGCDGELNVTNVRDPNPLTKVFIDACVERGYPRNNDFNGVSQYGAGPYQVTQKDGRRFSSAKAFLNPVKKRANLTVLTGALVRKVIIEDQKAVGVEYQLGDGNVATYLVNKEVILCGGAINSPHLLMLSGVGDEAHLKTHGIDCHKHLPGVGQNLMDHLDMTVMIKDASSRSIGFSIQSIKRNIVEFIRYFTKRRGMLASNASEAGAFLSISGDKSRPDIQLHFLPSFIQDHGRKFTYGHGCTIHVCQLRPKSRGCISLGTSNPVDPPKMDPNYLSDSFDAEVLVKGVKLARQIFKTKAFSTSNGGEEAPGTDVVSDKALREDIQRRAETIYHPAGTCKMGVDDMAVVNPDLKVIGIDGLRVADASIMPTLLGGNTNAPSMVIGEKVSRSILAQNT